MHRIILASASPRRRELLRRLVRDFDVAPPRFPEPQRKPPALGPTSWAEALAYFKARGVADLRPGAWVIGADTVVCCAGELLGQPADVDDARRMLLLQSGRESRVITAVALVRLDPEVADGASAPAGRPFLRRRLAHAVTRVWARDDPDFVESYLASGQWRGKAGAYGIQDAGDRWIERIEGSLTNVVGLPLELLTRMLSASGIPRSP